jgi:Cytochrome C oxidase, cbb3-type, subunit III
MIGSTFDRRCGASLLIAALAFCAPSLAQDDAKVRAGLEVWKSTGCAECHGAFADGEKQRDEAPSGANLRQTRLDDAALTETIRCGREGTGMPKFGEDAYTPRGCYGKPAETVPAGLYPAARALGAAEIDAVVVYLRARVVGRRAVTKEECEYYYGKDADLFCEKDAEDK